jgi:hypothetical protein
MGALGACLRAWTLGQWQTVVALHLAWKKWYPERQPQALMAARDKGGRDSVGVECALVCMRASSARCDFSRTLSATAQNKKLEKQQHTCAEGGRGGALTKRRKEGRTPSKVRPPPGRRWPFIITIDERGGRCVGDMAVGCSWCLTRRAPQRLVRSTFRLNLSSFMS